MNTNSFLSKKMHGGVMARHLKTLTCKGFDFGIFKRLSVLLYFVLFCSVCYGQCPPASGTCYSPMSGSLIPINSTVNYTPDTIFVCEGDSFRLTSNDSNFVSGGINYFINFATYHWEQLTCGPYSSNMVLGTEYGSSGNTSWNVRGFFDAPGLYLFTITALCQYSDDFDTLYTDTAVSELIVRVKPSPVANAGTDTLYCDMNNAPLPWIIQLDGNDPSPYNGYWMSVDASGPYAIADSTDHTTSVNLGTHDDNYLNIFRWTIVDPSNGCSHFDDVIIRHPQEIHPIDILPDTIVVCANQIQFAPNGTPFITQYGGYTGPVTNPTQYTYPFDGDSIYYEWEEISAMPDSLVHFSYLAQNCTVTVDSSAFYTFKITIHGYCGTSSDSLVVKFLMDSGMVNPWPYIYYRCDTSLNYFSLHHDVAPASTTLYATIAQPAGGGGMVLTYPNDSTFLLSNILNDTLEYFKIFYGFIYAGVTPCTTSAALTLWNPYQPWQNIINDTLPCGQTSFNFAANVVGYGNFPDDNQSDNQSFEIVEFPTGLSPPPSLSGYLISGMTQVGEYKLEIKRFNYCNDTIVDTLVIVTQGPPPPPSAGIPLTVPCGANEINLASNVAVWGIGWWSIPFSPNGLPIAHPDYNGMGAGYDSWVSANFSEDSIPNTAVSNLSVSGTYLFQWNITSEACGDYFDIVQVYVPDPELDTAFAGTDTIICDTAGFWLHAGVHPILTGNWTQDTVYNSNPVVFSQSDSSSTQIFGLIPGQSYQFYYTLNGACNQATDSVIVVVRPDDCCFAQNSPLYTQWPDDVILNVGTVMSGKYFINGIVTVNSWIDMTNVDLVFGECAGMVFGDSAQIRANNSVFRPCAFDKTWLGFEWAGSKNSIIENCTFKNAYTALNIGAAGTIQIKNNLFSNCATAILLDGTIQSEAITGNTFVWDTWRDSLFVNICPELAPQTNSVSGIVGFDAYVKTIVSGNEFTSVNYQNPNTPDGNLRFEGVYFIGGSIHLSNNRFTNNSVAFSGAKVETYFTNNTIESNTMHLAHWADLFLDSISFASINGNRFVNYVTYDEEWGYDKDAIYITNSTGATISIEHNYSEGYSNAFVIRECKAEVFISENEIVDVVQNGIYVENSSVAISCNQINGKFSDSYLPTGIRLVQDVPYDFIGKSVIRSNCIYETHIAILVEGPRDTVANTQKHIITNNMLYNYNEVGLYVIGYSLQSGPGNSYISNNAANGMAADIHTSLANVISYFDYGANILSPDVANGRWIRKYFADSLHSTASCGNQISEYPLNYQNQAQATNTYTVCIPIKLDSANVYEEIGWGSFRIMANAEQNLLPLSSDEVDVKANYLFKLSAMNQNSYPTIQAYNTLVNLPNLSSKGKTALEINYRLWQQDYQNALSAINAFTPNGIEQEEWKLIQQREINQLKNKESYAVIENWDKENLTTERSIDFQKRYIHAINRTRPVIIIPVPETPDPNFSVISVASTAPKISVYPNPMDNEITVQVNCKGKQPLSIQIADVSGNLIHEQITLMSFGTLQIALNHLSSGIYLIKLIDADGNFVCEKFVKQ